MSEEKEKATIDRILLFMTTEQFTLRTARAATITESNGRASLFIGAVSSAVVALAFIGQASGMSEAFFVFGLVLFPSLIFLGTVTFERVLQTALEDWLYGVEIARIRHFYAELAPEMRKYFTEPVNDDVPWILDNAIVKKDAWQFLLTGSGMVGIINSILVGAFAGLLCKFVSSASIYICALTGIIFFAVAVFFHHRRQAKMFTTVGNSFKPLFPSDSKKNLSDPDA